MSCVFHSSETGTSRLVWPARKVPVAIWNLPGRSRGQPLPSAHGPSLALQFPQEKGLLGLSWINSAACSFQSRARNLGHRKTLGSEDLEAVGFSDGVESSPGRLRQDCPASGSPVSHDRARESQLEYWSNREETTKQSTLGRVARYRADVALHRKGLKSKHMPTSQERLEGKEGLSPI